MKYLTHDFGLTDLIAKYVWQKKTVEKGTDAPKKPVGTDPDKKVADAKDLVDAMNTKSSVDAPKELTDVERTLQAKINLAKNLDDKSKDRSNADASVHLMDGADKFSFGADRNKINLAREGDYKFTGVETEMVEERMGHDEAMELASDFGMESVGLGELENFFNTQFEGKKFIVNSDGVNPGPNYDAKKGGVNLSKLPQITLMDVCSKLYANLVPVLKEKGIRNADDFARVMKIKGNIPENQIKAVWESFMGFPNGKPTDETTTLIQKFNRNITKDPKFPVDGHFGYLTINKTGAAADYITSILLSIKDVPNNLRNFEYTYGAAITKGKIDFGTDCVFKVNGRSIKLDTSKTGRVSIVDPTQKDPILQTGEEKGYFVVGKTNDGITFRVQVGEDDKINLEVYQSDKHKTNEVIMASREPAKTISFSKPYFNLGKQVFKIKEIANSNTGEKGIAVMGRDGKRLAIATKDKWINKKISEDAMMQVKMTEDGKLLVRAAKQTVLTTEKQ